MSTASTTGARSQARAKAGTRGNAHPGHPAEIDPTRLVWVEAVPGGSYTTGVLGRGTRLRLIDPDGGPVLICCCSGEELSHLRVEIACGRNDVAIQDSVFAMADYRRFLSDHADGIDDVRRRQAVAFAAERQAWDRAGEFANQLAS